MAPEIETGISQQEVKSACDYLLALSIRGCVCVLPEQHIIISTKDGAANISIRKPGADQIAVLKFSGLGSLNPTIAIKRPFAYVDLELFDMGLPKFHPDEGDIDEAEVKIRGHEAQKLLVNMAQALKRVDARLLPLAPRN